MVDLSGAWRLKRDCHRAVYGFKDQDSLTASELRIAEMAASGLSNQQVAEALFVTSKTVENHLGRVYQKLGIHSRDEIADALRDTATPATGPMTACAVPAQVIAHVM